MAQVSVIIVNWNGRGFLADCLESLTQSVDAGLCDVVVVDNGSTDGSIEMLRRDYTRVKLIETGTNLGFTKANNIGLARVTTDYALLLNSDTVVTTDALVAMLNAIKSIPDLYACGCEQITKTGEPWRPFGRFPTLKSEFITMTGAFNWPPVKWLINVRKDRKLRSATNVDKSGSIAVTADAGSPVDVAFVDYVSASCMMIDREKIVELGGLDENYFFHSEDVDLCLRIKRAGGKVGYIPSVSIRHYLGGSQGKHYRTLLRQWMLTRSYLFRRHYGRLMQFLLLCTYGFAGSLSVIKWVFVYLCAPRRRDEASGWIKFWVDFVSKSEAERELKQMGSL